MDVITVLLSLISLGIGTTVGYSQYRILRGNKSRHDLIDAVAADFFDGKLGAVLDTKLEPIKMDIKHVKELVEALARSKSP